MQKKLIALAVAGVVAAPLAMAQSSVTIYGIADVGYGYDGSHTGTSAAVGDPRTSISSRNKMQSGGIAASRLGFRGTEDLGNGLKAGFIYEVGVSPDEGNISTTNVRTSVLNLSGDFGTLQFGRQLTPQNAVVGAVDPFATTGVGSVTNVYAVTNRLDNLFAYVSPSWNGLQVAAGWTWNGLDEEGLGNESASPGDAQVFAIAPTYRNGPLFVGLNYHRVELKSGTAAIDGNKTNVFDLAGSWDFGVVKVGAVYGEVDANRSLRDRTGVDSLSRWMVGASAPVGEAGSFIISYTDTSADRVRGLRDLDADQWAIGYIHRLSNRTRLYAKYAEISYNGAMRDVVAAGTFKGADALLGADSATFPQYRTGFAVGLSHSF